MTDIDEKASFWLSDEMTARVRRRKRAEARFRFLGLGAIWLAIVALAVLLASILYLGLPAFTHTQVRLDITFEADEFRDVESKQGPEFDQALNRVDFAALIRQSLMSVFPDVRSRSDVLALQTLVSRGARFELRDMVKDDPSLIGQTIHIWLPVDDEVDLGYGHTGKEGAESGSRLSEKQVAWLDGLKADGRLKRSLAWNFFTSGDSREPELAGIRGALVGSFYTLLVTLIVVFPLGVASAVYLEEFAPKNRVTDLIEVNINNLAAVPSIVFGLLGLAVYLNTFHLPRSAPLVGGLTLALMTLPTIIIAGRAALKAVPPSLREAATGLGASPVQVVFHHVLPLSMPGILTGTIIGMAQALGETAPLLMIGMVAFIVDIPGGVTDAATVLPVQIFLWADSPERAFLEKTAAAILVLLAFLVLMNAIAIWCRNHFEKRW